jgi:prolyl-tRNA synthetase
MLLIRLPPLCSTCASKQWLIRAGFMEQLRAGLYVFHPLAKRVLNNIERILHQELQAVGRIIIIFLSCAIHIISIFEAHLY